jgi:hypothetical protein
LIKNGGQTAPAEEYYRRPPEYIPAKRCTSSPLKYLFRKEEWLKTGRSGGRSHHSEAEIAFQPPYAFDAITGRFERIFKDQNNNVISIEGFGGPGAWGLVCLLRILPISLTMRYFSPPALTRDMMVYSEH